MLHNEACSGLSTFLAYVVDGQRNPKLPSAPKEPYGVHNFHADGKSHTWSAGLDCSGFAERAADYQGSGYLITGGNETKNKVAASAFMTNINSWQIALNGDIVNRNLLSRLVPGDILINTDHVIIVHSITYSGAGRTIDNLEQIKLIHATRGVFIGDNDWQVKINNCFPAYASYQFRRLRR